MKGLTIKQHKILVYIQNFIEVNHYSPSYREIMTYFSLTSPATVYKHIHSLIRKGALHADKHVYRSLTPIQTPEPIQVTKIVSVPLIGNLSVGYPLELFVRSQMVAVPSHMISTVENTYILQTQGDSLIEEGIRDGDLLLIEAKQDIHPGEIILGLINQHDSVLKRYYPDGPNIRLESQNPYNPSLSVRCEHILIQGILIGLLRSY